MINNWSKQVAKKVTNERGERYLVIAYAEQPSVTLQPDNFKGERISFCVGSLIAGEFKAVGGEE